MKELIEYLEEYLEDKEYNYHGALLTKDNIETIVDSLKQSYEYRWHDLRKDPNDLPDCSNSEWLWFECVHEEHEDDPLYATYQFSDGEFGLWKDVFDPVSLGFVDSEFETIDDLHYTPIVAWRYIKPFEKLEDEV